jgi:hypothetical protein
VLACQDFIIALFLLRTPHLKRLMVTKWGFTVNGHEKDKQDSDTRDPATGQTSPVLVTHMHKPNSFQKPEAFATELAP